MNIVQRVSAPTPIFFKRLRNIGLALVAISAAIITSPIVLPAAVLTVAGYIVVAGSVIGAVSQFTTAKDNVETPKKEGG